MSDHYSDCLFDGSLTYGLFVRSSYRRDRRDRATFLLIQYRNDERIPGPYVRDIGRRKPLW
jgi:hypothetical protein